MKILWNCLVKHVLQNISFCVQQKKEIHTGLKLEGEYCCMTDIVNDFSGNTEAH